MSTSELDEIDREILRLLGEDARNTTPVDIACRLPVSDGTVRNRIDRMESAGVIKGYVPVIDHAAAGYPLTVVFSCNTPPSDRKSVVEDALEAAGVVSVREFATGGRDLEVTAAVRKVDDILETATRLHGIGLEVVDERIVCRDHRRPCSPFEGETDIEQRAEE